MALHRALQKLSKNVDWLYPYAYAYYKQGKYVKARDLFYYLTVLDPRHRKSWMGLGASQQMLENYGEALHAYEMAVALEPMDIKVHLYAADCCFALGQNAEGRYALECAERALKNSAQPEAALVAYIMRLRCTTMQEKNHG